MGTSYNLLTKNCNHFTSFLCQKLTGRSAPSWLNRAASIGVALPCEYPIRLHVGIIADKHRRGPTGMDCTTGS